MSLVDWVILQSAALVGALSWDWITVFLAMVAVDFAWTKYNMACAARKPHQAALWSSAIILLGAFTVVSYTQDHTLLLPAALGAYLGTWYAVWRERAKSPG
jgi:hypothetical protein